MNLLRVSLAAAALLALQPAARTQNVTSFCFGEGCPCGNDAQDTGCGNRGVDGFPVTGAQLEVASGSTFVCSDDLVLRGVEMAADLPALLFMGASTTDAPLGDGRRCVAGGSGGLFRFSPSLTDAMGEVLESDLVDRSMRFGPGGELVSGSTWNFQMWYRDPGGPCGTGSNTTNALAITFLPYSGGIQEGTRLAGRPLDRYPWFQYVSSFPEGGPVHIAVDPLLFPQVVGRTAEVWIVEARTLSEWEADDLLVDARGVPRPVTFGGSDVRSNTFVVDPGFLPGTRSAEVGVGYDMVIDLDRDGRLGPRDLIDGLSDQAGFYVVRDTTAPGPYGVQEALYSGGSWLGQKLYWPSEVASLGELPLLVVSHGNGHNFQWYDHIGHHMASYGYVVMSHQNQTGPGIESASTTTLRNTDYLLGNLDQIAGGELGGHVDREGIFWIGHSRGGEGVVRAYTRLAAGNFVPDHYGPGDVTLVSSIAPTVFLSGALSDPLAVDYHLWVGSADSDVTGGPNCNPCQSFQLLERARGRRASITLQGAGHGAFHAGGGDLVANGPCLINRPTTHALMRGYLLPMARFFRDGDPASRDFLWRQFEEFHPIGAPIDNPCVVVNLELKDESSQRDFVVHDWESGGGNLSSSGGAVSWTVENLYEGQLDDGNQNFTWRDDDPMNGMTRSRVNDPPTHGVVFDWSAPAELRLEIVPCERDLSDNGWLSFRACQMTRHPLTRSEEGDLSFSVALVDGTGRSSSISIAAYGGGVEEPYARSGQGLDVGWGAEFESIRLRLTDFLADGSGLDLTDVAELVFEFGGPSDSVVGRLGLDDVTISLR